MFDKAKTMMEDHLKVFGVNPFPPIVKTAGDTISYQPDRDGAVIAVGSKTDIHKLPLVDWMVVTGLALLHQNGSDLSPLFLGSESERDDNFMRVADDLFYILDLIAIYQCYLQNPVEAYCIYDDAIELHDEASLHPIAVALGLSHPRGLESMGFDRQTHQAVLEEADFFKSVITQKRPDRSLLVALENAWQKQKGAGVRITVEADMLRFTKVQ